MIVEKTIEFSLKIIEFTDILSTKNKKVVANQLLRSGTSIGANVWEAQNAESKADFIHKMKIAAKEADESEYWLVLCQKAPSYPDSQDILPLLKSIQKYLQKSLVHRKTKAFNPFIFKELAHRLIGT